MIYKYVADRSGILLILNWGSARGDIWGSTILITASMASTDEEFEALIAPMWDFYNTTPDRVPMTDWYFTDIPHYREFIARSVVGGFFIRMLEVTPSI